MKLPRVPLAAAFALVLGARAFAAQVPAKLALVVMLKVLTYDAQFPTKSDADFLIVVPAKGDAAEVRHALDELQAVAATRLSGRTVKLEVVAPEKPAELGDRHAAAVLFLAGTPAATVKAWSSAAEHARCYSLGLDTPRDDDPVLLGVEEADGKPRVVVNRAAASAIGAQFAPAVLKVARVVR